MTTLTLFTFRDASGNEYSSYSTMDQTDAEVYGARHNLRIIANTFEWSDSEVHEDHAHYTLDQLDEGTRATAVEKVRDMLSGSFDRNDIDNVKAAMLYKFAEIVKCPGWDTKGEGDFELPDAFPSVQIDGFDLERGQSIEVSGTLSRDNAPALPWIVTIDNVQMSYRDGTQIYVHSDTPDCDCGASLMEACAESCMSMRGMSEEEEAAMENAVRSALQDAWQAGYAHEEYRTSEKGAREWAEANEVKFTHQGEMV